MSKTFSERMKEAAATNDYDIVNDLIKNDPDLHNFRYMMQEHILGRDKDLSTEMVDEILRLPALKTRQPHLDMALNYLTNIAVSELRFDLVDKFLDVADKWQTVATNALATVFNRVVNEGYGPDVDMAMIGARANALIARGADEKRAFSEGNYHLKLAEERLNRAKDQRADFMRRLK